MSTAIVTKLTNFRPVPNADRLQIADAAGYQVLVGLDIQPGAVGLVFPEGLEISPSLAMHARLYRKNPQTGEAMSGYLDPNGRVQTVRLRGVESRGLWLPLTALEGLSHWTPGEGVAGPDANWEVSEDVVDDVLTEGQRLDAIGGVPICRKYQTRATRQARTGQDGVARQRTPEDLACARHYETGQFREQWQTLPDGEWFATLKMHGTSGRTGRVLLPRWWERVYNAVATRVGLAPRGYRLVTGTRRVAPITATTKLGRYRWTIHERFAQMALDPGEVWYYEIVGYDPDGGSIMGEFGLGKIRDKELRREVQAQIGTDRVVYSYGCQPGEFGVWVYRVVRDGRDLRYDEMCARVGELGTTAAGMLPVPLIARSSERWTLDQVDRMTRSRNDHPLERTHPREGVVVHVEMPDGTRTHGVKHKGFVFCAMEGIAANDRAFLDVEDAA